MSAAATRGEGTRQRIQAASMRLRIESICTRAPSLEDVFLHLTAASSIASEQPADAPR